MDYFTNNCAIFSNAEFGRYLASKKEIKTGEILFEEEPFSFGPKQDSPCLCLSCFMCLDGSENGPRCSKCGWPLCNNCENSIIHKSECDLFSKNSVKFQNSENITLRCPQIDCITVLRVLLEKEANPKRWESEIMLMEDHEKERRDSDSWIINETNIVKYLHGPCKLKDRFSGELIQKVIGILEVNAFEAKTPEDYSIRCLYPKLALLANSCTPNIVHSTFPSDGYKVKIRGAIEIKKGDLLYSCYTYTLQGTRIRQEHLLDGKYFICRCKRCLDPTELQTHFSSFKCKCDLGLIISTNPLDEKAEWKCTHCPFSTSGIAVKKACDVMQSEIEKIKMLDNGTERLQYCEKLMKKYRSVLHPNHFIQTSLRQILIELYGRVEGYEMQDLPDILLEHKIELCQNVLKVLQYLEPGKTRSRALMLYELHVPLILIARSHYERKEFTADVLKIKIEEIIKILEECVEIMEWEDKSSSIGVLAEIAKQGLKQLKDSVTSII